jgi:hypothetical protein
VYLPTIVLSREELLRARQQAERLHDGNRARGLPDAHGAKPRDIPRDTEAGAQAAELAAAKWFRVPWTSSLPGARKDGPDIGRRTQVRRIQHHSRSLIVRPSDIDKYGNVPFVLVYQGGDQFTLLGWIMAYDARRVGEWTKAGRIDRPPAWFVSQCRLRAIEALTDV